MKWYQKKIKFQNKEIILTILVVCFSVISNAQEFDISGELRPRFESRHGFGTLSSPDDEAANFISQRARINLKYTSEKYEVFFAMQNVRVWGDVSTLASSDKNGTTFHQAWAQYNFSPKFSIKIGRQEIDLDDQRIFGSVGWAQQARSHDALLLKFKTGEKGKLDIGLALNANGETLFKEEYEINQYKSLQYAWYHTNINDALGLSFLFLNNGLTYNNLNDEGDNNQETTYSQTIGGRLTYGKNRFDFNLAGYYQGGNTPNSVKDNKMELSAYYFTVNGKFKLGSEFVIGAGMEFLSGNDQGSSMNKNNSFNPFYGTNHKFNGWMDYFYVGNHINNVGLLDINTTFIYQKNKLKFILTPHFFSADGDVLKPNLDKSDAFMGTEIDFEFSYKVIKDVLLNVGYSQMFATETMEIIKGGSKDETNNWAWVMITFKPTFFHKKLEK